MKITHLIQDLHLEYIDKSYHSIIKQIVAKCGRYFWGLPISHFLLFPEHIKNFTFHPCAYFWPMRCVSRTMSVTLGLRKWKALMRMSISVFLCCNGGWKSGPRFQTAAQESSSLDHGVSSSIELFGFQKIFWRRYKLLLC